MHTLFLRIWKLLIMAIVLATIIILLSSFYTWLNYDHTATEIKDCGVIFGAAVWRDDQPSHALYDRTIAAAELYHDGLISCIILSGGASTYGAHEVTVMQNILLENDVPNAILTLDKKGKNTTTTLNNLDDNRSYILISNDFHLGRIKILATRADLTDFDLHAVDYKHGRYSKELYFFFRETIGTIYYFFGFHRLHTYYYKYIL